MHEVMKKTAILCDMDGVIYHGSRVLEGVQKFVQWMIDHDKQFLFVTNSAERTPQQLSQKLQGFGLAVDADHFYTSAMATAEYLSNEKPGCTAYVVGEPALVSALGEHGIYINDVDPDYVVLGETPSYCYEKVEKAIHLVNKGAVLIGTNPDIFGFTERGIMPAAGAMIAPIEMVTGKKAYFVGKPNPLMLRNGLRFLGRRSEEVAFIGDSMETDILAGIESDVDTVLVLSGVTKAEDIDSYPYRPKYVVGGVGDLIKLE